MPKIRFSFVIILLFFQYVSNDILEIFILPSEVFAKMSKDGVAVVIC